MYVCICKGITDNEIRKAVVEGARSLQQVSRQLGVSTQCGQCTCMAKSVIEDTLSGMALTDSSLYYAA